MKAASKIPSSLPLLSDGTCFRRRSIATAAAALFALPGVAGAATINVAGACIFRDAIIAANNDAAQGSCPAGSGADIIVLPAAATITAGAVIPSITSEITIQGHGSFLQRNPAVANFRVLTVTATGKLTVEDMTIRNGRLGTGQGRGGAVLVTGGELTLTRSTVSGNTASDGGGGIAMNGGTLNLQNSTISGNDAPSDYGGGIFADSGAQLALIASTVSGNLSGRQDLVNYDDEGGGAGIHHAGGPNGSIVLKYSTISGNSAWGPGGGIDSRAPVLMSSSTISGNTAAYGDGGGIRTQGAALNVKYSSISDNRSADDGGGIVVGGFDTPGSLALRNSTVSGNSSAAFGGGIVVSFDAAAEIRNSTISGNTARTLGGGINVINRASAAIVNSTITGNLAQGLGLPQFGYGGGIASIGDGALTLERSIVAGNDAPNFASGKDISSQAPYGTFVSEGFNVLGTSAFTSAQAFRGITTVASDRTATSNGTHPTTIGNIVVVGLADNGGPTRTHNLSGSSPARDFIPSSLCSGETDQRGVVRPRNGAGGASANECDAGSVESAGFNAVNLSLTKTSNGPVLVGAPLTYTLTLRNAGPEPANGIDIYDSLPPGLSFVSATDSSLASGYCSYELETVGCRLAILGPDQSFTVNLITRTSTTGPVTNTASFINDTKINTNTPGTDFDAAVTTQVFGPSVTLSASPASIAEAGGVATLRATLSQVVTIPITVNLAYTGTAGTGDSTRPTSITVPAGATGGTATITATQDTLDEDNETVIASISSVPNGTIGVPGNATVTIVDDDAPPNISFLGTTQTVSENAGTVTVRMNLSAVSGRVVTVPLSFAGTANNPADYTPSGATLTIPAGSSFGTITLNVVDDTFNEANETVIITAGTPVNANFVGPTVQTVTILDNDAAPDSTPDKFTFIDISNAPLSTVETSNSVTVTGTNAPSAISVEGGTYSIGCAEAGFTASAGTIAPGATVCVRLTSAAKYNVEKRVALTIGGVVDRYSVTTPTKASKTPAFRFSALSNVQLSSINNSNTVTPTGLTGPTPISVTDGQYSIGCVEATLTASSGTIEPGQTVCLLQRASPKYSTTKGTELTIGGTTARFATTTVDAP